MNINVLEWLEGTVKEFPTKSVFMDENSEITFEEVLKNAKAIGSRLIEDGVKKEPVAVISERNIMTPVAYLGVVYSGCSYAPIDAKLPVARIKKILGTLRPNVMLVEKAEVDFVKTELGFEGKIICIEDAAMHGIDEDKLSIVRKNAVETDPLYIIFTSGSTGNPKGVMTSHHSLMCYIESYAKVMGINSEDRLGNQSPLDYIAAIRDIYLPLRFGCSTVIIPKEYFMEPNNLFGIINRFNITAVGWSVSALTVMVSLGGFEDIKPESLKKICFSGSVMPCKCLRVWQENLPEAKFVNQYGPTEATASCTYYEVTEKVNDDDVLPIGIPYDNYKIILLNRDGTETKVGEEGEICISGPILALGYYNDIERTKNSFIQNPLNSSYDERIYKTGDIGLLREDGILEFHGRMDRQIKHMGHRVELDEIEYAANSLTQVDESLALYNKERETLFLFYTGSIESKELLLELKKELPGFMVPRKVTKLEEMPKLANGKIDMAALREKTEKRRKK